MEIRIFQRNTVLLLLAALTSACAVHGGMDANSSPQSQAVEAGIPALDGSVNVGNSQAGAISLKDSHSGFSLAALLIPDARASVACGEFAVQDSCSSGVKKAGYSDCQNWGGSITGTATLTYSDSACGLGTTSGQTLTRTANLIRAGLQGGTVITDSEETSKAYDGTSIGAGSTLTYNGSAYELSIEGVHKIRNLSSGATDYDVDVETSSPITLTGSLSGTRIVDGGALVLYNNTAKYKAVFVPHTLSYSSPTCCHPVSGSLDVTYAGSIDTTGSITFTSTCGVATLTIGPNTQNVQLEGCE